MQLHGLLAVLVVASMLPVAKGTFNVFDVADTSFTLLMQALHRKDLASDPTGEKQVVALLSIPLDTYDAVTVLGLHNYPSVMSLLSPPTAKQMAVKIVNSILSAGTLVSSEAKVELLFGFIAPLVKDVAGTLDDTDDEVRHCTCTRLDPSLEPWCLAPPSCPKPGTLVLDPCLLTLA